LRFQIAAGRNSPHLVDNSRGGCSDFTSDGIFSSHTWPACDAYIWKFVERHAQFYHFVPLSKGWA